MAPIYSVVLFDVAGVSGDVLTTTLPPGFTYVVRELECLFSNGYPLTGGALVSVQFGAGVIWKLRGPEGIYWTPRWHGRKVVAGGDTITVSIQGGATMGAEVSGSGYQLTPP